MKMRILVTGGTGFIGSHFLRAATNAGHEVYALRRNKKPPKIPLDIQPFWIEGGLDTLSKDLGNAIFPEFDVLVHLAAVGVSPEQRTWDNCFQTNVVESLSLFQYAVKSGIRRLIVCGSCFEYGKSGEKYDFIPVNAPLEPTGPYHATKAAATMAALGLAVSENIECAILRPFHVFGEGEEDVKFWPSLRKAAISGEDYPMTWGEQIRDFVPVENVVSSILQYAVEKPLLKGKPEIHNIGSGNPSSLLDFATSWWKIWKANGQIIPGAIPYRSGEVMRYVPKIE
jgi:nucleoside-diphosphate-sugar epimerase